jgi:hypothetical protein
MLHIIILFIPDGSNAEKNCHIHGGQMSELKNAQNEAKHILVTIDT